MDSLLSNYTNFMYCIESIIEHIKIDALDAEYYHEVSGNLIQYSHKSKNDLDKLIRIHEKFVLLITVKDELNKKINLLEDLRKTKNINFRKGNRYFVETYSLLLNYRAWFNTKFEVLFNSVDNTKTIKDQHNSILKPEQETPKTFDELFYNSELVTCCIDILKKLDPPLIDTDCNYIGKSKGVFCVWIEEMQRQGIVKHYSDRKIFASLLPTIIKRFSIDESMFGKQHKKAEANYRTDIKTLVSQIKLSQNSQLGD